MIYQYFPSKRIVEVKQWPMGTANAPASLTNLTHSIAKEAIRRDKVVRDMALRCKWKVGDLVSPWSQKYREEFGAKGQVVGIAQNLIELGKESEWPKDDEPKIITVRIWNTDNYYYCTDVFLISCVEP